MRMNWQFGLQGRDKVVTRIKFAGLLQMVRLVRSWSM